MFPLALEAVALVIEDKTSRSFVWHTLIRRCAFQIGILRETRRFARGIVAGLALAEPVPLHVGESR